MSDLFAQLFKEDVALGQAQSLVETGAGGAGSVLGSLGVLASGNPWAAGLQFLSGVLAGDTSQSGAASQGQLNTSGWVVGEGDAQGGKLDAANGAGLPWYVWPLGALLVVAVLKKVSS